MITAGAPAGSSPLARGLPRPTTLTPSVSWIIPARAGFTCLRYLRCIGGWDHPRSRGVYSRRASPSKSRPGSSPLARGLRGTRVVKPNLWRIIPARAGFTMSLGSSTAPTADHPRSRGVYARCAISAASMRGSAPLARGLPDRTHHYREQPGIIPARAGFTATTTATPPSPGDHPRSRGVYGPSARTGRPRPGSSPLARGLRAVLVDRDLAVGIIPARAGFTG